MCEAKYISHWSSQGHLSIAINCDQIQLSFSYPTFQKLQACGITILQAKTCLEIFTSLSCE